MTDLAGRETESRCRLVIVTGSGRSGTSTVAGTLKRLGLYIPQPENEADSKNPRGYYEPAWATRFNKNLLRRVAVHNNDARPEAVELARELAQDSAIQADLRSWLNEQVDADQILVKDPRILWLSDLWTSAASSLNITPSFLTMLRHPAEVAGSRDLAYLSHRPMEFRHLREAANVAGWTNIMLVNEKASRGYDRAFVRYTDLIEDWRDAIQTANQSLFLTFNTDLGGDSPHEVDDFIDVDLRRSRVQWQDINVPPHLWEIADAVWSAMERLVEKPGDPQTLSELDELRESYDRAHGHAVAFAHYSTIAAIAEERKQVRQRLNRKHQAELRDLRDGIGAGKSVRHQVTQRGSRALNRVAKRLNIR